MKCSECDSDKLYVQEIPFVGNHVICYDCNAEWVE